MRATYRLPHRRGPQPLLGTWLATLGRIKVSRVRGSSSHRTVSALGSKADRPAKELVSPTLSFAEFYGGGVGGSVVVALRAEVLNGGA